MNEGMLTNTMLVIGIVMVILVVNFCFHKYSRLLLWAEGLIAIVGALLGIGLGWVKLFLPDGYPNFPNLVAVTIIFAAGVAFIIAAEKVHKQMTAKDMPLETDETENSEEEIDDASDELKILPLKGKLDTPLANIIFKKALEAGLMSVEEINGIRQYYHWNESKVLLDYMCARIYCGDYGNPLPDSKDVIWNAGKGIFPSTDLDHLFNVKNLGQQRSNRLGEKVPQNYEKIDQLFS